MNDTLKEKLKKVIQNEKNKRLGKALKLYKGLVLTRPSKAHYWYYMGIIYLKMGKNKNAWEVLCNAKKLGSVKATQTLEQIMNVYLKTTVEKTAVRKARKMLLGKEV